MKRWNSAEEVFAVLNNNYEYLIFRNFEGFFGSILLDNHADVDILLWKKDKRSVIHELCAIPRLEKNDGIHYKVLVADSEIPIDIRTVGDGYYDKRWETKMLSSRQYCTIGFYRMNDENYFWSLLYHSLYHKGTISEEYCNRLKKLSQGIINCEGANLEELLAEYMLKNGYFYTIAKDKYLWYHFSEFCDGRIRSYPLYPIYMFGVKCKEFVINKLSRKRCSR